MDMIRMSFPTLVLELLGIAPYALFAIAGVILCRELSYRSTRVVMAASVFMLFCLICGAIPSLVFAANQGVLAPKQIGSISTLVGVAVYIGRIWFGIGLVLFAKELKSKGRSSDDY